MPYLQIHPSRLQAAHAAAKARAKEIADREPTLISAFALGEVIAEIEADQILHGQRLELTESITLNRVLARLKKLIPAA